MATVVTRRNHLVTLADQVNTILENARDLIMSSEVRFFWVGHFKQVVSELEVEDRCIVDVNREQGLTRKAEIVRNNGKEFLLWELIKAYCLTLKYCICTKHHVIWFYYFHW